MITLGELQEIYESRNSYYNKIDGKTISILILKYPYSNFELTIVSKKNPNHVENFYGSLSPFDTFDLVREFLSPLNDK